MRKKLSVFGILLISIIVASCGGSSVESKPVAADSEKTVTVGFSQLGAESDWRSANTKSMQETFENAAGYELLFEDGQQKQSNQITAIRKFVQQEVDYIVLAPVTEEGWDTVLNEVRDAKIPIIMVDRMVDVEDQSLFNCWVGSDFYLEGRKVTAWLDEYIRQSDVKAEDVYIVDIQGNIGASAQIGRTKGLCDACEKYGWNLVDLVSGEFTQAKGREVMEYFLKKYENINVVYCENDNEALGAIEAIEAAGRTVGCDIANGEIMVLSFDGVNEEAVEYCKSGKISCIGECNPLHGPRVLSIIETLEMGNVPEKFEYVSEKIYSANDDIKSVIVDGAVYPVDKY